MNFCLFLNPWFHFQYWKTPRWVIYFFSLFKLWEIYEEKFFPALLSWNNRLWCVSFHASFLLIKTMYIYMYYIIIIMYLYIWNTLGYWCFCVFKIGLYYAYYSASCLCLFHVLVYHSIPQIALIILYSYIMFHGMDVLYKYNKY